MPADVTGHAVAHADDVPTHWLAEYLAVKSRHAFNIAGGDAEDFTNRVGGTVWHPATGFLYDFQRFDRRRTRLFVMMKLMLNSRTLGVTEGKTVSLNKCVHHQRSTSAITKSILPRYAIKSATMLPRITEGICCKCGKLGVRMRVR